MMERYSISVPDARLAILREKVAGYDWDQLPDAGGWQLVSARPISSGWWTFGSARSIGVLSSAG